jgi:hypothetical protein
MMRIAFVILFFVALHFALRSEPPADPGEPAQQAAAPQEVSEPVVAAPADTEPTAAPPQPAEPPPLETDVAETEAAPPPRSGEAERPGEQRTSQRTGPTAAEIEDAVRKELNRLYCYYGRPEKRWGPNSRSALRRFTSRAKPKGVTGPNEAMLRILRDYPANYCRSCRPGQAACNIKTKRSEATPAAKHAAPELSYLPPWMIGQKTAAIEDDIRTDATEGVPPHEATHKAPPRRAAKTERRKSRRHAAKPSARRRASIRNARRYVAPRALWGWMAGY